MPLSPRASCNFECRLFECTSFALGSIERRCSTVAENVPSRVPLAHASTLVLAVNFLDLGLITEFVAKLSQSWIHPHIGNVEGLLESVEQLENWLVLLTCEFTEIQVILAVIQDLQAIIIDIHHSVFRDPIAVSGQTRWHQVKWGKCRVLHFLFASNSGEEWYVVWVGVTIKLSSNNERISVHQGIESHGPIVQTGFNWYMTNNVNKLV